MEKAKCVVCGLPTVEDPPEDIEPEETLCNSCYEGIVGEEEDDG